MTEFRYEMHMHTSHASLCGRCTPQQMVKAYKNAGYAGAVITDHFIHGHTAVDQSLPWPQRMQAYYDAYLQAEQEAKELDFDVFFGIEHAFGDGKELLVYGVTLQLLQAHPEIESMCVNSFCRLMRENGCYISLAHPYRCADYISVQGVTIDPSIVNAAEVYNACNTAAENEQALAFANRNGLHFTSGGDIHSNADERIGKAGMVFEKRIYTNERLVQALKDDEGRLLWDGKIL